RRVELRRPPRRRLRRLGRARPGRLGRRDRLRPLELRLGLLAGVEPRELRLAPPDPPGRLGLGLLAAAPRLAPPPLPLRLRARLPLPLGPRAGLDRPDPGPPPLLGAAARLGHGAHGGGALRVHLPTHLAQPRRGALPRLAALPTVPVMQRRLLSGRPLPLGVLA